MEKSCMEIQIFEIFPVLYFQFFEAMHSKYLKM